MRHCDHTFVLVKNKTAMLAAEECAVIMCAYCGQVRHLYPDGRIVVAIAEGELTKAK